MANTKFPPIQNPELEKVINDLKQGSTPEKQEQLSEELKKDPKVVTVSVHDVPAEKWQEHLDAIPGEERFY